MQPCLQILRTPLIRYPEHSPALDRPMELHIRLEGRKGLADQLYQQLRDGIDSGH